MNHSMICELNRELKGFVYYLYFHICLNLLIISYKYNTLEEKNAFKVWWKIIKYIMFRRTASFPARPSIPSKEEIIEDLTNAPPDDVIYECSEENVSVGNDLILFICICLLIHFMGVFLTMSSTMKFGVDLIKKKKKMIIED